MTREMPLQSQSSPWDSEGAAAVPAPVMPSTSATVAGALLLAVALLVVPALLPTVSAPPMELLLLPVVVMALLIFVARGSDSLPSPRSGQPGR